ncbi:MAG: tail fiber domain-containing protein [Alphaproteobacteria bacterium]|nr:tail fiber domain-containing protein [Alphaproteobacteria bacterium]
MFRHRENGARAGFTLIEMAIVMGVMGVLAAGVWRMMASSSQQSKDQMTGQQQAAVIAAVKGYLNDTTTYGGQTQYLAVANATETLPSPSACPGAANTPTRTFCSYLPSGFSATNPYGQSYTIKLKTGATNAAQNYSFMVMTSGGSAIPDADGGRLSTAVGGDGGFIYTSNVCGSPPASYACGLMGSWSALLSSYGLAGASGHIASQTFVSAASVTNSDYYWLARVGMPGDAGHVYNTMTTDLYMGTGTTLQLGSNQILGANTGSHPSGSLPQINLHGDYSVTNAPASLMILSNAPSTDDNFSFNPLPSSGTGCSVEAVGGANDPSCPAVLNIPHGDLSVGGGVILANQLYSLSDKRAKTDIKPLKNALENIMKIKPVSFVFKTSGAKSLGVIAQQLQTVYPQLISHNNNGTEYVNYSGLIAPLIGAVQDLKHENDTLRAQVESQSKEIDALKKTVSERRADFSPHKLR